MDTMFTILSDGERLRPQSFGKKSGRTNKITLGPAYYEFAYYEHPAITSGFFSLIISINV